MKSLVISIFLLNLLRCFYFRNSARGSLFRHRYSATKHCLNNFLQNCSPDKLTDNHPQTPLEYFFRNSPESISCNFLPIFFFFTFFDVWISSKKIYLHIIQGILCYQSNAILPEI